MDFRNFKITKNSSIENSYYELIDIKIDIDYSIKIDRSTNDSLVMNYG